MEQPWPKVVNGQHAMNEELQEWTEKQEDEDALLRRLFRVLQYVSYTRQMMFKH